MRLLQVHNAYRFRGGEDAVVEAEAALLRARGHEVIEVRRDNDDIAAAGALRTAIDTVWSRTTVAQLRQLVGDLRPDLLHAHNTHPLISPSLYWAADAAGVPVVQTLHNFRLVCPQAMLLRDGRVCESCLGRAPLPAVVHACYRGSRAASAVLGGMLMVHRALGTYAHKIDRYIALNEFCREKFVQAGLPAQRIAVKPNFVASRPVSDAPRAGLLFVGRLSVEKGVDVLAAAASELAPGTLNVIGTGPQPTALNRCRAAQLLGHQPAASVAAAMARSVALVFPSLWYETFGMVIIEAFAAGTPVIASRLGAALDLVKEGETGLLVDPGNATDLREKLCWALDHPEQMAAMGQRARALHHARYTPEANHGLLMTIYADAMAVRQTRHRTPSSAC